MQASRYDINPEVTSRVREAADILQVVGEHVRLRRRGRRWQGLCPFHDERTPSFSVDAENGLYYCFGCHAGGDVIGFVMEMDRLDFPSAVELLARRFGVTLPARSPEARRQQQEVDRIRSLLEEAQHHFVEQLGSPAGARARDELVRRGFDPEEWQEFGFGYAPDEWRVLLDRLLRRHPETSIVAAGLAVVSERGGRAYDRFRNRLTFPIRGTDGRLVAFGGRILGDGEPKYLNSPESAVFHKRSTLFLLDKARRAMSELGEAVVVEGYFDCFSLHRVEVRHAVATLGTALTGDHARILRRLLGDDGRVVLCYDADDAGRRAAAVGARVLLEAGIEVAIAALPSGQDPDDLVRGGDVETLREVLGQPLPLLQFLLGDLPEESGERRRLGLKLAPLVCAAANPATRQNLVEELARQLYLSPSMVVEAGGQVRRASSAPQGAAPSPLAAGERTLAVLLLRSPDEWRKRIVELVSPELIADRRVRLLLETTAKLLDSPGGTSHDYVTQLAHLCPEPEVNALVAELCNSDLPDADEHSIRHQLRVVVELQGRERARRLGPLIAAAEERGDQEELARLLAEKARLRRESVEI